MLAELDFTNVVYQLSFFKFHFKNFYTIFKGYSPFIVITKYWLCSPCCTTHPWAYLTLSSLYLPLPYPYIPPTPQALVCSLYLWVCFFFVIFISLLYFLDSTYKWYHTVFVFLYLTYFTWQNTLQVHPCCCKWQSFISFYGWVIFHCIYVPHLLYPFICRWTLRLLPCPGYCK